MEKEIDEMSSSRAQIIKTQRAIHARERCIQQIARANQALQSDMINFKLKQNPAADSSEWAPSHFHLQVMTSLIT